MCCCKHEFCLDQAWIAKIMSITPVIAQICRDVQLEETESKMCCF